MARSRFDIDYPGGYDLLALAKNECRALNLAQPKPSKATIQRGFFVPIDKAGGLAPFVFCYGGLHRAAP
jgi:hypothetical protein